jgi:voltage-gated potassium channel
MRMPSRPEDTREVTERERSEIVQRLEDWFEGPLVLLGFVWLALLIVELLRGLSPMLEGLATAIWAIFVLDFAVRFALAPRKLPFLRSSWLTVIALLLPALRLFRVVRMVRALRAARAVRGLRLVRLFTSLNRGMRALGAAMGRRGFAYVAGLTVLVTAAGAAGMYAFENEAGLRSYGAALWWTAMIMTTMGSDYWPQTGEGRVLCLFLSTYAFAMFGYVTATIASFFIGRDAEDEEAELAGADQVRQMAAEIAGLRADIRALQEALKR